MKREDIKTIWEDDHLGRAADAEYLAQFLVNRSADLAGRQPHRAFVLNLNARWGDGKTFFLTRLRRQMKADGHITVYVDAWRDDFADDPLIAVMAAIDTEMQPFIAAQPALKKVWDNTRRHGTKIAAEMAKGAGKRLLSAGIGEVAAGAIAGLALGGRTADATTAITEEFAKAGHQIVEALFDARAQNAINDFRDARDAIDAFKASLRALLRLAHGAKKVPMPLVVFVDELDRCRPPYAIALLERLKHLFDIPNVVFVVATNTEQLSHSIGAVYGAGFGGKLYLNRFFDYSYRFAEPRRGHLAAELFRRDPISERKAIGLPDMNVETFIAIYFDHTDLDPRSIEQQYELLHTITTVWEANFPLQLVALLPWIGTFRANRDMNRAGFEETLQTFGHLSVQNHASGGSQAPVKFSDLASLILRSANADDAFATLRSGSTLETWLRRIYSNERDKRGLKNEAFKSAVVDYPSIVMQAGRLTGRARAERKEVDH